MPYPSRLLGGAVRAEVASSAAVSPCGWLGALAMVRWRKVRQEAVAMAVRWPWFVQWRQCARRRGYGRALSRHHLQ